MTDLRIPGRLADAHVELTVRAVILGVLLTVVFTAANVYMGLRVGLTFSSAIPAAVLSMAVLRAFRGVTIQENTVVQTLASAAGALSAVCFVLPGLVMVGWWTGFPFWMSFGVCAIGGILGVMFSIPLRRALVTNSTLPYPEGVAAAEVLKVGSGSREAEPAAAAGGKAGFVAIVVGTFASAAFSVAIGMRLFAAEIATFFRVGAGATGFGANMSLALLAVGHLAGVAVGIAMLVGVIIAWGVLTPMLTAMNPQPDAAPDAFAVDVWRNQVRFIGAGAIGAAAIWTLGRLIAPIWKGLSEARAAARVRAAGQGATLPRTERDIPIATVALVCLACLIPLGILTHAFLEQGALTAATLPLVIAAVIYIVIAGFMVSAVCGYMAGLIGSSNSPVSSMAILAVLGAALLLAGLARAQGWPVTTQPALVAFALFVTAALIAVAVVANDNLQDLKTGQLVDATPWKQQVALVIGVIAGAVVIPPVLDLLNQAYGFAGAPHLASVANDPLPAPQATLVSTLARGVIGGDLDWGLIGWGALIGAGLVLVDELLRRGGRFSLPPLAVGLAMYLPTGITIPVIIGGVLGWLYDKRVERGPNPVLAKNLGVLTASGLIVGEGLFNVALAAIIVGTNNEAPLAVVGEGFAPTSVILSIVAYVAVVAALYWWSGRKAARTTRES